MSKEDDYRANAAKMVGLANRMGTMKEKRRLLVLAEKWLDLADRAKPTTGRRNTRLHPLVRKLLGDDRAEAE